MLNYLKNLLYLLTNLLATIGWRKHSVKKVLIIRVDEIGDYILWRNFLPEIAQYYQKQGFQLDLAGNRSWESLFTLLDRQYVQDVIWLDKLHFKKNLKYRYTFLKKIFRTRYQIVINPTFSRDRRFDDSIVYAAKAALSIGLESNKENTRSYDAGYDEFLYTHLYSHPEKPVFEFELNKVFSGFICMKKSLMINSAINLPAIVPVSAPLPEKYFIIFPGSRNPKRIWSVGNFIAVANYLYDTYGWMAVVCGGKGDQNYADQFCSMYKNTYHNLTGKTSLPQLLLVLQSATCLISVDTGSVHLAAAVNCPVFGIFNGSQYRRFAPYPQNFASAFYAVYPEKIIQDIATNRDLSKYEFIIDQPYDEVNPQQLVEKIEQHFLR